MGTNNTLYIIKKQKFQFETISNCFSKEKLNIKDEKRAVIASFQFNMIGFIPNFQLSNDSKVKYNFPERGEKAQIKEFKKAIMTGFVNLKSI